MIVIDKRDMWKIDVTNDGVRVTVEDRCFTPDQAWELGRDILQCLFDWHNMTGRAMDEEKCR